MRQNFDRCITVTLLWCTPAPENYIYWKLLFLLKTSTPAATPGWLRILLVLLVLGWKSYSYSCSYLPLKLLLLLLLLVLGWNSYSYSCSYLPPKLLLLLLLLLLVLGWNGYSCSYSCFYSWFWAEIPTPAPTPGFSYSPRVFTQCLFVWQPDANFLLPVFVQHFLFCMCQLMDCVTWSFYFMCKSDNAIL